MNSNLMRSLSKKKFASTAENLTPSLDQKNSLISVLQSQVENLRGNEERLQRLQQCVFKSKQKYESLIKDYDIMSSNNQERADEGSKSVHDLRVQCQQIQRQLQYALQQLRDVKAEAKQLVQQNNLREDEILQVQYKGDQLSEVIQLLINEGGRTAEQIVQIREEIQKQRNEAANIIKSIETLKDKYFKIQSYNRNLIRQEQNTNDTISKIQEENNHLDERITQLNLIQASIVHECSGLQNQIQQGRIDKATRQLNLKKLERENKEIYKNINLEKSKIKSFNEQWEHKKCLMRKLENEIRECSQEINCILAKSRQVAEVNGQLRKDLKVCQLHLQNILRVNKNMQGELGKFKQINIASIKKLQEPLDGDHSTLNRDRSTSTLNREHSASTLKTVDMNRLLSSSSSWNKQSRLAATGSGFQKAS